MNPSLRHVLAILALTLGFLGAAEPTDDWWSFQPLLKPSVPQVAEVESPIDQFILAALHERGLTAAEPADKRTLMRRLYFDLIGLPPAYEDVEAFVRDEDPEAYAKLVDDLLASPQYGERWARHWLDVVHFGETHGYDKDKLRPNAYPYRDYVIRAFNEDKPYARFVNEQLAGDALYPDTVDGVVATGFIAAGPWDFIGHAEVPEEKIDGKIARHLDRDDMVTTTMNAFCSLTVQCAQCHDHKRDPVTMRDYYSLQAVFAAVDRADREYDDDPNMAKQRAGFREQTAVAERAIERLEKAIEDRKTDELRALDEAIANAQKRLESTASSEGTPRSNRYGYHSEVTNNPLEEKWVQVDLGEPLHISKIALFAADEYGFADFGFPARYRIEASSSAHFDKSVIMVDHTRDQSRPGASSAVIIDGKDTLARYLRLTATKLWNRRQKGQAETSDWILALGELAVVSRGTVVSIKDVTALDSIEAGDRWAKQNLMDGVYGAYPLADMVAEDKGLLALLERDEKAERRELEVMLAKREAALVALAPNLTAQLKEQRHRLARAQAALAALPKPKLVYAGTVHTGSGAFKGRGHAGGAPRPIFVLHRGDVTQPLDAVEPATVPGIVPSLPSRFELAPGHGESDRRVGLAQWITHPDNTLTWRSIVNRVWHYHFGRGIVDTPNDFGRIGGEPSHPDLLDWLAVEFRDAGGSIKDLHRQILNSETYKQASVHQSANAASDSSNRYLWRQNRRRLEAEAIRDSVLTVAGKLDHTMHGPSFMDFVIEKPEHSPHYQYHKADPDDASTHRRSIYRFLVRSQPQPFMDTLDCADPSELVDQRGETNTALQALAMLNNRFMVRMAEHFAERVQGHHDPVDHAVSLALSRQPTDQERQTLSGYAQRHGLPATCRLIFNLNEFSFVD